MLRAFFSDCGSAPNCTSRMVSIATFCVSPSLFSTSTPTGETETIFPAMLVPPNRFTLSAACPQAVPGTAAVSHRKPIATQAGIVARARHPQPFAAIPRVVMVLSTRVFLF